VGASRPVHVAPLPAKRPIVVAPAREVERRSQRAPHQRPATAAGASRRVSRSPSTPAARTMSASIRERCGRRLNPWDTRSIPALATFTRA
jgi:hypothetical protein